MTPQEKAEIANIFRKDAHSIRNIEKWKKVLIKEYVSLELVMDRIEKQLYFESNK